jgi:hypothetical protein
MHTHYTTLVASLSSQLSRVKGEANALMEEKNAWRREEKRLMEALGAERREVERLEGVVKNIREECNLARGVRVRMQWEMGQIREEMERLRKAAYKEGEAEKEYPGAVVDAVRKEMSEKLEIQVASRECSFHSFKLSFSLRFPALYFRGIQKPNSPIIVIADAQEQKSKRLDAERKLAEVQQQLRAVSAFLSSLYIFHK